MRGESVDGGDVSKLQLLLQRELAHNDDVDLDPRTLRYALYARKSTESTERQARSIPDQIEDCYEHVVNLLKISIRQRDIFTEQRSAKEAGTRPVFRKLIDAIENGQYDGIIAWHPDRLARNMKDAGEIIDLIDRNVIKDLRFARAHFENTPSGKMTLGISFVLSKHYSEHLSESVNRGNKRITESGGVLYKHKHGYRITDDHKLIADDDNYIIIQRAFEMRQKGETQQDIVEFLNNSSYQVYKRSQGHQVYTFDRDAVSKMLKDPAYAGIVRYGTRIGRISDYDPAFTPMLSEEEFLELHGEENFLSRSFRGAPKRSTMDLSNFLRRMVKCGHCGRYMGTSAVAKKLKSGKTYYFYFRCDNKGVCPAYGKNVRGNIIIDYVLKFLANHSFTTETNYQRYRSDVEKELRFDTEETERRVHQGTQLLANKKREFENAKRAAADPKNAAHGFYTAQELKKLEAELQDISKALAREKQKKSTQSDALLTYDEFLELFGNTVELLRSTKSMTTADEVIRTFFLNFTVKTLPADKKSKQKQWSVIDHCLQKTYDEFVKNGDFLDGGDERT